MPRNISSTKEMTVSETFENNKIQGVERSVNSFNAVGGHWMNNSKRVSRKSAIIDVLFIMSSAYCLHSVVFMFYVGALNSFPLKMLCIWIIHRWRGFITRRTISGILQLYPATN